MKDQEVNLQRCAGPSAGRKSEGIRLQWLTSFHVVSSDRRFRYLPEKQEDEMPVVPWTDAACRTNTIYPEVRTLRSAQHSQCGFTPCTKSLSFRLRFFCRGSFEMM